MRACDTVMTTLMRNCEEAGRDMRVPDMQTQAICPV